MSASVTEQILARVLVVLTGSTSAGTHVERGRRDAIDPGELPALVITRESGAHDPVANDRERVLVQWSIDCFVRGADWEAAADALHMQVHQALAADSALAVLGRGLRCTETTPLAEEGDATSGRLTARYQMQALVRPYDLTKQLK